MRKISGLCPYVPSSAKAEGKTIKRCSLVPSPKDKLSLEIELLCETIGTSIENNNILFNDSIDNKKKEIIRLFNNNIKNKNIDLTNYNTNHDGREGHWLEKRMNIKHNSSNNPDINGYEMKKDSKKITFGDYSASEYLHSDNKVTINETNKFSCKMTRKQFIEYFGNPNNKKNNRFSWSGICVPKYEEYNDCGQILQVSNKDICIYYSYSKDKRIRKESFPTYLKNDNILIAIWKENKLKQQINNKFNNKGFFICKKINNKYNKICFGKPFNYDHFIENIKNKLIIFDSGMYEGNSRNYSQFRSTKPDFWNSLIVEEY
jgi:hypothetical protein